jgi:hypothetical protein
VVLHPVENADGPELLRLPGVEGRPINHRLSIRIQI